MLTSLLLLIITGLTAFHLFVRYRRKGRCATKVPGPSPYPFIGNMLSFDISSPVKLWQVIREVTGKYYPITRVWLTMEALFSIRHPDDFEILLTNQRAIEKAWTYEYLHPWLKRGLLTSSGEKWWQRRKMLTPAFHFNILSKYMEITQEQGECMIKYLQSEGKETVQSLMPFCSKFTLNIICEAAMGVALDKIDTKTAVAYKNAIYKIGEISVWRMARPFIHDWMMTLTPFLKINRDLKKALNTTNEFTSKVVKERREYHEKTNNKYLQEFTDDPDDAVNDIYMERKKRLAMLDLLLLLEKNGMIDEEGIKEEVETFTFEGHDTTGMAMTFTLMLLAENEDAQNTARAEIVQIIDESGGRFSMAESQKFSFLERCIKESIRLYPPVSTVFRYIAEDLQLKNAMIPAQSSIICQFFDLHRDPNYWPEPEKFDPDRFLYKNIKNRHPFAYLPFSAGPRNCIGQKFAMNELKSLIGRILYHFKLEPVDRIADMKIIADIVIRPSEPFHVKFIKIDRS